jgi:hypothetical protein
MAALVAEGQPQKKSSPVLTSLLWPLRVLSKLSLVVVLGLMMACPTSSGGSPTGCTVSVSRGGETFACELPIAVYSRSTNSGSVSIIAQPEYGVEYSLLVLVNFNGRPTGTSTYIQSAPGVLGQVHYEDRRSQSHWAALQGGKPNDPQTGFFDQQGTFTLDITSAKLTRSAPDGTDLYTVHGSLSASCPRFPSRCSKRTPESGCVHFIPNNASGTVIVHVSF